MRCVLHELVGRIKPAAFIYDGYSLCGRCVRAVAHDHIVLDQTVVGFIRDAIEEKRIP